MPRRTIILHYITLYYIILYYIILYYIILYYFLLYYITGGAGAALAYTCAIYIDILMQKQQIIHA